MWKFNKNPSVSFQRAATIALAVLVIPLFVVVIFFDYHTIIQQRNTLRSSYLSTLRVYESKWDDTISVLEDYLEDTVVNNADFAEMVYANTKTQAYLASLRVDDHAQTLLRAYELIGAFFLYSKPHDYYRLIYTDSYNLKDLDILRQRVMAAANQDRTISNWEWVDLSDRTILLFTYSYRGTVAASMVDPAMVDYSGLEKGRRIFYAMPGGQSYAPKVSLGESVVPQLASGQTKKFSTQSGEEYELTGLTLSDNMGTVYYAVPFKTIFEQLTLVQYLLLGITFVLLAFIPLCWLTLRRLLLEPVGRLTRTMRAIQRGDTAIRVPETSRILEVNQISHTVNAMLDTIQQQKIDAYEQRLTIQHAQLQYLHLQIRPHFFLNCLNIVYSLAGEKKYAAIQDLTLNLSGYLRSIFSDGSKLVPLMTEMASVENYIRIQQAGAQMPPELKVTLDADMPKVLVPPLSLLTFVENSVKHSSRQDSPLEIRIKCSRLAGEEGEGYLYITISDNGGGFPPEELKEFNTPQENIYVDHHVGIANIRSRLRLLYGSKATLSFRNLTDGACVELFLPINSENAEDELE